MDDRCWTRLNHEDERDERNRLRPIHYLPSAVIGAQRRRTADEAPRSARQGRPEPKASAQLRIATYRVSIAGDDGPEEHARQQLARFRHDLQRPSHVCLAAQHSTACLPGRCGPSSREYPTGYYRGLSLSTLSIYMVPLS
jgi:hypothetical protein